MGDQSVTFIVATECLPEVEEKFNKWYDEVHIPMLLKLKGLKEVTRFKVITEGGGYPTYMATYKFENMRAYEAFENGPILKAARAEIEETWKTKRFEIKWRVAYQPMNTWKN